MSKYFFIFISAWLVLFSDLTMAEKKITIYDIGTLPGGYSTSAVAINSKGMIIGFGNTQGSECHAFIWSKKTGMIDIGALPNDSMSEAVAINSNGDVVGRSADDLDENPYECRAFIWNVKEGMQDIGTLGGRYTIPNTITENGTIAGTSQTKDNTWHAFIWKKNSGMTDLGPTSPDYSYATRANNADMVTGTFITPNGLHPFFWTAQEGMQDIYTDISSTMFSHEIVPTGINSQGTIIGYDFDRDFISFIWNKKDGMQRLGTLPLLDYCVPVAINDNEIVVGNCSDGMDDSAFVWKRGSGMQKITPPSQLGLFYSVIALNPKGVALGKFDKLLNNGTFKSRMFIWDEKNGFQDLITADTSEYYPYGINQEGQITGNRYSVKDDGISHAFFAEVMHSPK